MAITYITSTTVGSGGTSSISISNIPQTFVDLLILVCARTNRASVTVDSLKLRQNSVTTSYTSRGMYMNSGGANAFNNNVANDWVYDAAYTTGAGATTNSFGYGRIYIFDYTSTDRKIGFSVGGDHQAYVQTLSFDLSTDNSSLTSLTFAPNVGSSISQYSTITVYGVK